METRYRTIPVCTGVEYLMTLRHSITAEDVNAARQWKSVMWKPCDGHMGIGQS